MNKLDEATEITLAEFDKLSDEEKKAGNFKMTQSVTFTYRPVVTMKDVKAASKLPKAPWFTRLLLKFIPTHYSMDEKAIIPYKDFKGKRYIMISKMKGFKQ